MGLVLPHLGSRLRSELHNPPSQLNTMGPLWETQEEKPQSSLNPCEMEAFCLAQLLGESYSISTCLSLQPESYCRGMVVAPVEDSKKPCAGPSGLNNWNSSSFSLKVNPGGKTLEERRSSLDAEIDSLTSILADLESSSPYKPRTQQVSGTLRKPSGKVARADCWSQFANRLVFVASRHASLPW